MTTLLIDQATVETAVTPQEPAAQPAPKRRLPFEIKPLQFYELEISEEAFSAMATGTDAEQEAINALVDDWNNRQTIANAELPFSFKIPKRWGWVALENKAIQDRSGSIDREAAATGLELIADIAAGTEIAPRDVAEMLKNVENTGFIPEKFALYNDRILEAIKYQQQKNDATFLYTLLIRRAIPAWPHELTQSLHGQIFKSIEAIMAIEFAGTPAPKSPPSESTEPK